VPADVPLGATRGSRTPPRPSWATWRGHGGARRPEVTEAEVGASSLGSLAVTSSTWVRPPEGLLADLGDVENAFHCHGTLP
jgi:hypothetical protein